MNRLCHFLRAVYSPRCDGHGRELSKCKIYFPLWRARIFTVNIEADPFQPSRCYYSADYWQGP